MKTALHLLLCLGFTLPALAQTKEPETPQKLTTETSPVPSAPQIVANYLKAIGGTESWSKLKTQVAKGTYQDPEHSSALVAEILKKAPNSWLFTIRSPDGDVVHQGGFNGKEAWDGSNKMEDEEATLLGRAIGLWSGVELQKKVPGMKSILKAKVGDKEVLIVDAPFYEGKLEKLYFETETGLLVREDFETVSVRYEDYRTVDGVKLPFVIRRKQGESAELILKLDEIKHNMIIDDAKFSRP